MPIPTDVSNETPIYNKLSSYICINHFSLEKYFHKQKNVKAIKNQGLFIDSDKTTKLTINTI